MLDGVNPAYCLTALEAALFLHELVLPMFSQRVPYQEDRTLASSDLAIGFCVALLVALISGSSPASELDNDDDEALCWNCRRCRPSSPPSDREGHVDADEVTDYSQGRLLICSAPRHSQLVLL